MPQWLLPTIRLMRADKPTGTVLLAFPMLWALWLASGGHPPAKIVLIFLIGAFLMRSAGCVINDFADRDIDLKVKRTKDRPITSGQISTKSALALFIGLLFAALGLLLFLPNSAILPAVVAFVLSTLYPFTKRFFVTPQLILGLAFSMTIIMAYLVLLNNLPLTAWLLFIASTLWTVVYDTFYAMADRDDDKSLGVHSSALFFNNRDLQVCLVLTIIFLILMLTIGIINGLSIYYYLGLILASICFVYQFYIIRKRQRESCLIAFLNNQWVGALIFLGILLNSLAS